MLMSCMSDYAMPPRKLPSASPCCDDVVVQYDKGNGEKYDACYKCFSPIPDAHSIVALRNSQSPETVAFLESVLCE